jgi:hypothetical protein
MNNFLEIQYGLDRLYKTCGRTETGRNFKAALNKISPDITGEIAKLFDGRTPHFQTDTYFACTSERDVIKMDNAALLSKS